MSDVKEVKYDPKGYTVEGTVDVEGMRNRRLPNSNPGTDKDQMTYQDQPWDVKD